MSSFKSLPKSLDTDVRITLGGTHGRVTEELLDNSHVRTSLKDMGRGRVTKCVWRQTVTDNCLC